MDIAKTISTNLTAWMDGSKDLDTTAMRWVFFYPSIAIYGLTHKATNGYYYYNNPEMP